MLGPILGLVFCGIAIVGSIILHLVEPPYYQFRSDDEEEF